MYKKSQKLRAFEFYSPNQARKLGTTLMTSKTYTYSQNFPHKTVGYIHLLKRIRLDALKVGLDNIFIRSTFISSRQNFPKVFVEKLKLSNLAVIYVSARDVIKLTCVDNKFTCFKVGYLYSIPNIYLSLFVSKNSI